MPECARLACAIAMCDVAPPSSWSISVRMLIRKEKTRKYKNKQNTNKGQISLVKIMISAVDIEQVKVKLNENCALV